MPDVSLVIPFLNEEENLKDFVEQLNKYAKTQTFTIEAIFVDDGSTDSSARILKESVFETVTAKLIRLTKNYGSHAALRAGITQSEGMYTMFFCADLQEQFSMIGEMYSKALEGYDVVAARKAQVNLSLPELIFSRIYTALMRKYALPDYPQRGANNFLFSEKVRKLLCENAEANSSIHMQIVDLGFNRAIIDVSHNKRDKGKSKWTFAKKVKLFIDSFIAFSYVPIRAISILGIILFISGFLYALWIVIANLTGTVEFALGFSTIVSLLLVGFGLTNFALGIVAEYLWRTLDAARSRPVFIVDTVEILRKGKG